MCNTGKGAFGKVMKAQAEGIVPDTPDKDIVAVKTVKGVIVCKRSRVDYSALIE